MDRLREALHTITRMPTEAQYWADGPGYAADQMQDVARRALDEVGMGMTGEKITEVIDRYEAKLEQLWEDNQVRHMRTMLPQMREFLADGRREKLMRWLGFMQGCLWARGAYSLDELKDHNKPDEEQR